MKISELIGYLEHTVRRFGDIEVNTIDPMSFLDAEEDSEEGGIFHTDIGCVVMAAGEPREDGSFEKAVLVIMDAETAESFNDEDRCDDEMDEEEGDED